jgi:hypothetical protein
LCVSSGGGFAGTAVLAPLCVSSGGGLAGTAINAIISTSFVNEFTRTTHYTIVFFVVLTC